MTVKMTLNLRFDELHRDVPKACADAVDETMAQCVTMAKGLVRVDTATLQGSIQFRPAQISGDRIHGEWGSYGVEYAIYQEIGPVSGTRLWGFTPYLRPSADSEYPNLIDRVKSRLKL